MRRLFLLAALLASLLSSAVLTGTGSSQALTSTRAGLARTHCPPDGVNPKSEFTPPKTQVVAYLSDDPRLGPKDLPQGGPIGKMLAGYMRFDDTSPDTFLGCFWKKSRYANWRYPKDNGFVVADEQTVALSPPEEIDLFGNPGDPRDPTSPSKKGGQFLSPAGTPYKDRAIPPSNLDTFVASAPFNYHLYRVLKSFSVEAGPAAPWFDQPGGGTQYYLAKTTGDDLPANPGIANLVKDGYVQELIQSPRFTRR